MRALALLLVLATLAPLASAASGSTPAPALDAGRAFLGVLEKQGLLPEGLASAPNDFRAPKTLYRDLHPTCDLNGDGVPDLVSNDLDLARPPALSGPSTLVAVNGHNGSRIWARDNYYFMGLGVTDEISYARRGEALPHAPRALSPSVDLDHDGVCDLFAMGFDRERGTGFDGPPLGNEVSLNQLHVYVSAISGLTGHSLWTKDVELDAKHVDDAPPLLSNFGTASVDVITNFPTGFLVVPTAQGPELVLKTTDVTHAHANDLGLLDFNLLGTLRSPFHGDVEMDSVTITEHVFAYDMKGALRWTHDIAGTSDAKTANVTWLAGARDLDGDGEPDLVLDQLSFENPRGSSLQNPTDGKPVAQYAKGMNVLVLDGKNGAPRWNATVVDALAPMATPPGEESVERLVWEQATPVGDLDGDGKPEVLATWVAQEQAMPTSPAGLRRTHFVPLHGANGTPMWDVRLPGWGRAQTLDAGNATTRLLGVGMVDLRTDGPGRTPPRSVRLAVLDAATGASRWTYEKTFAVSDAVAGDLALAQFTDSLAPADVDGDGVLDLVTPAQEHRETSRDQVLLATASADYEVRSGRDGAVLETLRAWGPLGRVVPCGDDAGNLTIVSGHARRLDVTRFDLATGNQSFREPLFNDPAPRAASAGMDLVALAPGCAARPDGSAFVWANAQLFSFERRHEVVPVEAALAPNGTAAWTLPPMRARPSTQPLFLASVDVPEPAQGPRVALGVALGAGIGASLALVTLTLLSRLPARLLGVGLVLVILLAPGVGALALPVSPLASAPTASHPEPLPGAPPPSSLAPAPAAPTPEPQGATPALLGSTPDERLALAIHALGPHAGAAAVADALDEYLAARGVNVAPGKNSTESVFDSNHTVAYTWPLPDVTGDGKSDVLVDTYCVDSFECGRSIMLPEGAAQLLNVTCGPDHHVFALDAQDGTLAWDQDLGMAGIDFVQCGRAFVLGTFPLPANATGVVVYRRMINVDELTLTYVIDHEVDMLDAKTGKTLWSWTEKGAIVNDIGEGEESRTAVVQPLLMTPRPGTPALPRSTQPALLLEGIGWSAHGVNDPFGFTGLAGYNNLVLVNRYNSIEWLGRLDLASGRELWRADTFTADAQRSFVAQAADAPIETTNFGVLTNSVNAMGWDANPCCFDLSGDGVPDVVYREILWHPLPNAKVDLGEGAGPYDNDARLVAFDGASGKRLWDVEQRRDIPNAGPGLRDREHDLMTTGDIPAYSLGVIPVGDVDHDGASDVLVQERLAGGDFRHQITARSGKDGRALWNRTTLQEVALAGIGDADRDGADDLLVLDWYSFIGTSRFVDDYDAPQRAHLSVYSSHDGRTLWNTTTVEAPSDVALWLATMRRNGIMDLDGDGVGDVPADEARTLDDQTTVHKRHFLSGRDGHEIVAIGCVGSFCIPSRAPDVDGDGVDDVALVSGDMNDLWLTVHNGTGDHAALWARRIVAIPTTGAAEALPRLRILGLGAPGAKHDVLVNMHMWTRSSSTFITVDSDGTAGEVTNTVRTLSPQLLVANATAGAGAWALPRLETYDLLAAVPGATPGEQAFAKLEAASLRRGYDVQAEDAPVVLPAALVGAGVYAGVVALGVVFLRFRRLDEGVPDLE